MPQISSWKRFELFKKTQSNATEFRAFNCQLRASNSEFNSKVKDFSYLTTFIQRGRFESS